jgi:hypothetical protein
MRNSVSLLQKLNITCEAQRDLATRTWYPRKKRREEIHEH